MARDTNGSTRESKPRKRSKKKAEGSEDAPTPPKFMFIDSSNGGVNAKPDKVVRSFVMCQARQNKEWSTKPKSPQTETKTGRIRKPSQTVKTSDRSPHAQKLLQAACERTLELDVQQTSPSIHNSSGSSYYASSSTATNPSTQVAFRRDAYDPVRSDARAVASRQSRQSLLKFEESFQSLAVFLDAPSLGLLDQCNARPYYSSASPTNME